MARGSHREEARLLRQAARAYVLQLRQTSAERKREIASHRSARELAEPSPQAGVSARIRRGEPASRKSGLLEREAIVGPTVEFSDILTVENMVSERRGASAIGKLDDLVDHGDTVSDDSDVPISRIKDAVEGILGATQHSAAPEDHLDGVALPGDSDSSRDAVIIKGEFGEGDHDVADEYLPDHAEESPEGDFDGPLDIEVGEDQAADDGLGEDGSIHDRIKDAVDAVEEDFEPQAVALSRELASAEPRAAIDTGFELVGGIGPGLQQRLIAAGIASLSELAEADVEALRENLGPAGRIANVAEWIRKARVIVDGHGR